MQPERAQELLARERERIEHAIAGLGHADSEVGAEPGEPGDLGSEDLYQSEFDAGLAEDLADQLAALERAEARLRPASTGSPSTAATRFPMRAWKPCRPLSARSRSSSSATADSRAACAGSRAAPSRSA